MEESEKVSLWRQRFFEAQAAAEEFILGQHGQEGLEKWIAANAEITARLLEAQTPQDKSRLEHFMTRLFNQLQLYDSKIELLSAKDAFELVNSECGILRFRRAAEKKGVKLTFKSPCDYCETLNTAIATNYAKPSEISCSRNDTGCTWSAKIG